MSTNIVSRNQRQVTLALWASRIDTAAQQLDRLRAFIIAAGDVAPDQVNGGQFYAIENRAFDAVNRLVGQFEEVDADRLLLALTGRPGAYWSIGAEIDIRSWTRDELLADIKAMAEDHPAEAAELLNVITTRWPE